MVMIGRWPMSSFDGEPFFRNDVIVKLVDSMGDDEEILNAARVSYGGEAYQQYSKNRRLMRFLVRNGHLSPFRHAVLKFYLEVPIFVARQLMRHHVGVAWNELSGRYKELGSLGFYAPSNPQDVEYEATVRHAYSAYKKLIARGVPREQARGVLPVGTYTALYMTANVNALMNIWRERLSPAAQKETRDAAKLMWEWFERNPHFKLASEAIKDLWLGSVFVPKQILHGSFSGLTGSDVKHYKKLIIGHDKENVEKAIRAPTNQTH